MWVCPGKFKVSGVGQCSWAAARGGAQGVWCPCRAASREAHSGVNTNLHHGAEPGRLFPIAALLAWPISWWRSPPPLPTVSRPFKLNKCLPFPSLFAVCLFPALPRGASCGCIDLTNGSSCAMAPASQTQLDRCALAHMASSWDTRRGSYPASRGPSLTAQCSTCSGSISRTKSVTVRIAYTVNHGLIKLFSLWVKGAACEEGRRGKRCP